MLNSSYTQRTDYLKIHFKKYLYYHQLMIYNIVGYTFSLWALDKVLYMIFNCNNNDHPNVTKELKTMLIYEELKLIYK